MSEYSDKDIAMYLRRDALTRIEALERRQSRAIREALLGLDGATERLQDIENAIVSLRATLNEGNNK